MKQLSFLALALVCASASTAFGQIPLRQSTASQAVVLGPFVDETDGVTAMTALTIGAADVRISVNGGNIVGKTSGGCTHDELGMYACTFDATDTATVGSFQVIISETGALPVWKDFIVVEEAVFDACCAASATPLTAAAVVDEWESQSQADPTGFHVNVLEIGGTAQTANDNGADINAILIDTTEIGVAGAGLTAADDAVMTRLGAPAGASVSADIAEIESQTDDIGVAGAGLTAADDAIVALIGTPSDFGSGTSTVAGNLQDLADNGTAVFDRSTDSLQAIRDRGDAAWTGAGGGDVTTIESTDATDYFDALVAGLALEATSQSIQTDTEDLQSRVPTALVNGRIDSTVDGTGMEAGAVAAVVAGVEASDGLPVARYTNAVGDVCTFIISETTPKVTFDCTEAP
jgi:hypothetical protein